jgi:hypothetical protein
VEAIAAGVGDIEAPLGQAEPAGGLVALEVIDDDGDVVAIGALVRLAPAAELVGRGRLMRAGVVLGGTPRRLLEDSLVTRSRS